MGWLDRRIKKGAGARAGIGPREAHDLVQGGAVLLDVREPFEWQAGHAAVARHSPLGELGARLEELPKTTTLVVVCRSGHRSQSAASALAAAGYDALNLEGGMVAWAAAGLPVEGAGGGPGTIA